MDLNTNACCKMPSSPSDRERVMRDRYERGAQRTRKLTACPENTREGRHGHCYADSYARKELQGAYLADCPPGTTEGPAGTCWRTPHIFGRVRMAGWNGDCYPDEDKRCEGVCGASFVTCLKKCPAGYANDGLTCRKTDVGLKMGRAGRWTCPDKEAERINRRCWEPCRTGFVGRGKTCVPQSGPGIRKTVQDRMTCEHDQELIEQLCYPKCREGYKAVGKVCMRDCPDGFEPDPYRPMELCVRKAGAAAAGPAAAPAAAAAAAAAAVRKMSSDSARRLAAMVEAAVRNGESPSKAAAAAKASMQREAQAKVAAAALQAAILKGESPSKAAAAVAAAQKTNDPAALLTASAKRLLSARRQQRPRRYDYDDYDYEGDDYSPSPLYSRRRGKRYY